MKDRIHKVMDYVHLSQQDFAKRLGVAPATLSSIFTGRTNPTLNQVQAVIAAYPEISISWLLTGQGDMFNEGHSAAPASSGLEVELTDGGASSPASSLFDDAAQAGDGAYRAGDGAYHTGDGAHQAGNGAGLTGDGALHLGDGVSLSGYSASAAGAAHTARGMQGASPSSAYPAQSAPAAASRSLREAPASYRDPRTVAAPAVTLDARTRKIREIRVFFSDGTYESFVPSKSNVN